VVNPGPGELAIPKTSALRVDFCSFLKKSKCPLVKLFYGFRGRGWLKK